ncbi:MAG: hypothetical protein ACI37R_04780 [Candidatus Avigastranaerophilus sp.]
MKIQPISLYASLNKTREAKANIENIQPQNYSPAVYDRLSNVFYYPVTFSANQKRTYGSDKHELQERSGDFKISMFNDVTCPACGKKMLNRSMVKKIASDLGDISSDEYLDYIGQYRDYMRPVEASVYDEIYAISQKPGSTKDIRELIVSLRQEKLPTLQKVQMRQIKKMRALARTLPQDEKEVLLNKLTRLEKIVKKNKSSSPFRRKILIDRMSKVKIRNPKKYNKLQSIVKGFPTSKDMNSAWIVKYSGTNKENSPWTSEEIAFRFLSSSMANTDHILAYDLEDHHDDITNYMSMHSGCNSEKSNKPFIQWLNEDKANRIKYMQQYFADADELISGRKITKKKYKNYVALATQTVEEASRGQVSAEMLFPVKKKDNAPSSDSQAIAS